ncbi:MAG: DUF4254 domain-containing protein [Saprospiraceae bacterium]|nr:DUF4254 domain-containing protein [Saprospiraceae bacterium]
MITAEYCCSIFSQVIENYHVKNDVNQSYPWGEELSSIQQMLTRKSWIDTIQWHLEDIIRRPDLRPEEFIQIKRKIDLSNQDRTDLVEKIDDWFQKEMENVKMIPHPRLNTETPAWAIDRLSILMLKIYHMDEQTKRVDADLNHLRMCQEKLSVLMMQKLDLCESINHLISEIQNGQTVLKLYRQMKMYNDPTTNPELYQRKS